MILTLFIQVLQELNAILLIMAPLLAPHALIRVHRLIGAYAHGFPFIFFLGSIRLWTEILSLLVVLSHVDAINTTIVALDPIFLLDTHSYKLFMYPIVIHGVVIHLKGFEFLWELVEDQINQETILDSQIKDFYLATTLLILRI
jgi:hypothetical protein